MLRMLAGIAIGLAFVGVSGCMQPNKAQPTATAPAAAKQEPGAAAPTPDSDAAKKEADAKAKEEKEKKEAKEARDRERKVVRLQRDIEVARLRMSKTRLDQENGRVKLEETLTRTRIDLDLARQKLRTHKEISVPNRIERAKLSLQMGEDGLLDARQELEQLELMYKDEELADKTKEIVIDRAKRRLERTQHDLELHRGEVKTLLEITLPLETREQELGVQDKERALAQMDRDESSAKLDRQIALIAGELEITRLENELADVQEDIKDAAQKKAQEQAKEAKKG